MRNGFGAAALMTALLLFAEAISAEAIGFDLKQYDKLARAYSREGGREPIVYVEDRTPKYLLHRIVVEGTSADEWTEAFEILDLDRKTQPSTVTGYFSAFQKQADQACPSEWRLLSETAGSVTFERWSGPCGAHVPQHALYKVIYGPGHVWVVAGTRKGVMDDATRAAWLAVLETTQLDDAAGAQRQGSGIGTAVADESVVKKIMKSINLSESVTALANGSRCQSSIIAAEVSKDSKPESGRWTEHWKVDRCGQGTVTYRVELTVDERGRTKYKVREDPTAMPPTGAT